jgi:excisionase family DNA binding protein
MITTKENQAKSNLLTLREAALRLGCSHRTMVTLTSSGKITRVKIGGLVRIDPKDLDAFVEASKTKG